MLYTSVYPRNGGVFHLAIMTPLRPTLSSCLPTHANPTLKAKIDSLVMPVERSREAVAVPLEYIYRKCVRIELDNDQYVCTIPNVHEKD